VDNAGNTTDSETFSLTMACGGGAPAAWSVSPKGEFKILINNGAEETDNRTVVLNLSAGSDTARMAISESSDFINASQETFSATKEYLLSENEGTKTIYAKFYTQYGVASEVVSDSIILKTILTEPAVSGDEKSEISPFAKSSAEVEEKPKTPIKVSAGEEIVPSVEEEISSEEETVSPKREISPSEKAEKEKPREEIVNAVKSFLRYIWQSIIRFLQRIWPF